MAQKARERASEGAPAFDVARHCFPKQLPFVASTAKLRTACCSRRAGKSEGCAALLIRKALERPGSVALYLTLTRVNAKRIIWQPLKRVLRDYGLDAASNESDLSVTFPGGSVVYLAGAQHKDELEKFRGMPLSVVVIDEAQLLSTHLAVLLDEVLAPALMDYDGAMVLVGTPAPTPAGYFWECLEGKYAAAWERHSWTVFDNPWIEKKSGKTPQQHLEAELARRGVTVEDAKIQREWFARWAFDVSSLVFRYDAALNHFEALPSAREWECVIGVDLGWDDADAIAVLKWHPHSPDLYLVEEHVLPKQTITQLGDRLRKLVDAHKPLRTIVDTGGLGKKIAEELTSRWALHVNAADKERKLEHIELLNDALRSGHLKAKRDSRFAQECLLVEWDKSNPEKWCISERFHSDIADAVLYGYRAAKQWLATPAPEVAPPRAAPEWQLYMAARQAKEVEAQMERDLEAQTEALREKREAENEDAFW